MTLKVRSVDSHKIVSEGRKILQEEGVLLVKGLSLDLFSFEASTKEFCNRFFRVTSREELRCKEGDGFTTVTSPENFFLMGHVEVDYVPCIKTPDLGFLGCLEAPSVLGGETFLINGAVMFQGLPKKLQKRFQKEKIVYEFLWEPQRWKAQYGVKTEEELFDIFKSKENLKYCMKNGWLHMYYTTTGILHLQNGSIVFSNAILPHLPHITHSSYSDRSVYTKGTNRVYWESGEAFSQETVNHLIDVHDQCKKLHKWENNDLLIFDNRRFLHGREVTAVLSERKILSRFGYLNDEKSR